MHNSGEITRGPEHGVTASDVRYWVNAARFAIYTGMTAAANEYLNKASLIASITECHDGAAEIDRLVDELRARFAVSA